MKKNVRKEESFILAIYNMRHNVNEVVLALPVIIVIFILLIGAPIIIVLCELTFISGLFLCLGPILAALIFYTVRKKIIMNSFIRIKDVKDCVDFKEIRPDELETFDKSKVLMFGYSEYMKVVLYNWFMGLNVIGSGKLKMYKVFYDNYALSYLAVSETDLLISEEDKVNYEKETTNIVRLSDMLDGKIVNVKLYSRLSGKQ